jgi:hypothetical protein
MQVQHDINGKREYSFSFSRFMLNAVPNFANTGETSISPCTETTGLVAV